ncbi:MAG: hypothetical protein ACLFQX_12520 [Candidatus Kapaibacterium sp.]
MKTGIFNIAVILIALTLAGCQESSVFPYLEGEGPGNNEPPQKSYFPETIGSRWVYQLKTTGSNPVIVEDKLSERWDSEDGYEGRLLETRFYFEDPPMETGVYQKGDTIKYFSMEDEIVQNCLVVPLEMGKSWPLVTEGPAAGSGQGMFTCEVTDYLEIEVPAGKFQAWRIDTFTPDPPKLLMTRMYFVPEIGFVQIERDPDNIQGNKEVYELISYEIK